MFYSDREMSAVPAAQTLCQRLACLTNSNRVGGGDFTFHFGDHFQTSGQAVAGTNDMADNTHQAGALYHWFADYSSRHFEYNVRYDDVVDYFNHLFLGEGLIHRERWLPRNGLLEELGERFDLAIFTGRTQLEAGVTLEREKYCGRFFVIAADDVDNPRPHPEGLLKIASTFPGKQMLYVGDTVDDARSARAANVPFIGIAGPETPKRAELVELLQAEGAIRVLENINEIR